MNNNKPYGHGDDHRPGGKDPTPAGVWHYVGETDEPAFENGWANVGGTNVPMRFRLIVGRPNKLNVDFTLDELHVKKAVEIQGDVDGGTDGTTVFTLPVEYRLEYDVPFPAHDNDGVYVPCRLYADGRFVRGVA